jgi:predicted O-methyltransferase YrrM
VVVEIGTWKGGTLFCWSQVAAEGALLVSIDFSADTCGGYAEGTTAVLKGLLKSGQSLECLRADSHAPSSLTWLRRVLDIRPIDLLFIDGDHSYAGVKQDFETYSPLVTSGGLIAFHDIVPNASHPIDEMEVSGYWREIRYRHEVLEFIDPNGPPDCGMGIGVIIKR